MPDSRDPHPRDHIADESEDRREPAIDAARADLKDPRVVLSLLEADQVVAAKSQTHFGQRQLSLGVRILLWGLRVYVVIMMVIVLISVYRAFHGH